MNTQYTIFNIQKKITVNYPKSAAMGYFGWLVVLGLTPL